MADKPESSFKDKVNAVIFLVVAAGVLWMFFGPGDDDDAPATPELSDAECVLDLQCWGDRHNLAAAFQCDDAVERLARYTMEWTDGILEPKFSHFRRSSLGDGILIYVGDRARFQNGFGAWQNMIYECTYDPRHEQVLDATARPGRL